MTRGDKFLIVFVVLLVVISLLYIRQQGLSYNNKYISVQVDGEEIKQIIFDKKLVGKQIPIKSKYGENILEIGDEEVKVVEASCPDKIDVLQGSISKVGEAIVCLPNKMVIEIKGLDEGLDKDDLDIINN